MSEVEWMKEFGNRLKEILEDAWTSQSELAEFTGISRSTISKYVNGLQMPSGKAIVQICYVLDCTMNELMDFGETIDN